MNGYLVAAVAALVAVITGMGWRLDVQHKELSALRAQLQQVQNNGKTEIKYVDKIVQVAGPERIRTIVEHGLCIVPSVHGEPGTDAAAGTDSADRLHYDNGQFAGELSEELARVARNQAKLDALHEELKPQVK